MKIDLHKNWGFFSDYSFQPKSKNDVLDLSVLFGLML